MGEKCQEIKFNVREKVARLIQHLLLSEKKNFECLEHLEGRYNNQKIFFFNIIYWNVKM